jgi:hypothetical protein
MHPTMTRSDTQLARSTTPEKAALPCTCLRLASSLEASLAGWIRVFTAGHLTPPPFVSRSSRHWLGAVEREQVGELGGKQDDVPTHQ